MYLRALSVIQNELNGKSLVAEVYSQSGTAVSLLLIDTFTEKDINVNEKLCEQLTLPPLEEGSGEARSEGSGSSAVTPLPANAVAATAKATVTPTASLDRQMSPRDNGAASGEGAYSLQPLQADLPDELASMKELVPPPVPPVGSYFDVNVTLSANPSNFTVQSWSEGSALEQLQVEMNRHYSEPSRRTAVTRENLQEDKYFVARHSDGFWYRVRVNSQLDECTVAVRFVDYGDYSMIAMENLCLLASRFRNLPMQAINASLAGTLKMLKFVVYLVRFKIRSYFYSWLRFASLFIVAPCRHHSRGRRLGRAGHGVVLQPRGGQAVRDGDQEPRARRGRGRGARRGLPHRHHPPHRRHVRGEGAGRRREGGLPLRLKD